MPLNPLPPDPKPPTGRELADWSEQSRLVKELGRPSFNAAPWMLRSAWLIESKTDRPNDFWQEVHLGTEVEFAAYLKTPLWNRIQTRVMERDDFCCVVCRKFARDVHHRDYRPRVMSGEDITPLISLCAECHAAIHGGHKFSGTEVEAALAARVASYRAS